MKESDIDKAASVAMEKQYPNPAPLTLNNLRILLEAAQHGDTEYISPR
jgi:hypothetical protein